MKRHPLLCLLAVAAGLRLTLLAVAWGHPTGPLTPDSRDYLDLRDTLAHEGAFDREGQHGQRGQRGQPEIYRTPGYPVFLMSALPFGSQGVHATLLLQIALDVLGVYLVYLLGQRLCGHRAGLWAAAFQATSAVALASSNRVLSDGPFTFLLLAAVLLFVHHLRTDKTWPVLAAAVVLGLSTYIRAVAPIYMVVLGVVLLVRLRRPSRKAAANLLIFCVGCGSVLAPWIVRNAVRADYVGFSSLAADNAYFWAVPEVRARTEHCTIQQARAGMRDLDRQDEARRPGRTPGQAIAFRGQTAVGILRSHPLLYASLHVRGTVGFFLPGATDVLEIAGATVPLRGTGDVLRGSGLLAAAAHYFQGDWLALLLALPMLVAMAIQCAGVCLWAVKTWLLHLPWELWLFVALVVATSLMSGPFGVPRYRTQVEPLLSVLAGAGWAAKRVRLVKK